MPERRGAPRVTVPCDLIWPAASGRHACRIGDISRTGCFVYYLSTPAPGEITEITILTIKPPLALRGRVIYATPGIGFAVEFVNNSDETIGALEQFLDRSDTEA